MKKAIFFDIDGTLIECFGGIVDMSEKVKNAIYSCKKKVIMFLLQQEDLMHF